jgi:transcriptional regulator with XRE-family HTH domain
MARQHLSDIESGFHSPSLDLLARLARALQISLRDLVG